MKTIPLIVLITLVAAQVYISFTAGYYKALMDFNSIKLPYSIVDANGVEHRTACQGYTVINADSVEICNGVKIKYSKKKPINVIPK